jgi:methionyl-tRNA synthetase
MNQRRILVTHALPYPNGPLHFGHVLEAIQTDVWVRFQRLCGHDCLYVCATDAHGTPIMLKAREEGIDPEALVTRYALTQREDYAEFLVGLDCFHTTHSDENRRLTALIYQRSVEGGHISRHMVRQAYDEQAQMFLPDRYVRGTCPNCHSPNQYGDSCEVCSKAYTPLELIDPVSVVSGTRPVERESEHLFFKLADFAGFLREWTRSGTLDAPVQNKLDEWFTAGLRDWDISRDAPYFGFEIPGEQGKYFYVWVDAPVGYMASFDRLCRERGLDFDAYWSAGSDAELYHFIGKDIVYFHALFWPALLSAAGFRTPTALAVHGFLTINGTKMSKSRGTFITARAYLDQLPPEPLRYYFAAKLGPGLDDIDLNLDDFVARANSDLVGKFVNIASRCAGFLTKGYDGQLADALPEPALYEAGAQAAGRIAEAYEKRDYARAMREIMLLADRANQYIDERKPWLLARDPAARADVQAVCTQGLNLFRTLLVYLKPVLPALAARAERFLACDPLRWEDAAIPQLGTHIRPFEPLLARVDPARVRAILDNPAKDATAGDAA